MSRGAFTDTKDGSHFRSPGFWGASLKESPTLVLPQGPSQAARRTKLSLFEAVQLKDEQGQARGVAFFVGGPVWALDWCPSLEPVEGSKHSDSQFLATSSQPGGSAHQRAQQPVRGQHPIQIWEVTPGPRQAGERPAEQEEAGSRKRALSEEDLPVPVSASLVLSLAQDGGPVWALRWRPPGRWGAEVAGGKDSLGMLAAACGGGDICIWNVPHPRSTPASSGTPLLPHVPPLATCRRAFEAAQKEPSLPLGVEWLPEGQQGRLLAGYQDGMVTLWGLPEPPQTESVALVCFRAGSGPLRGLSWAPWSSDESGSACTVGHDGTARFWDLRDPFVPIAEYVLSRAWLLGVEWVAAPSCLLVTCEESSLRVLPLETCLARTVRDESARFRCLQPGVPWGLHLAPHTGLVAHTSSNGSVSFFQLTERYVRSGSRGREPQFVCAQIQQEEGGSGALLFHITSSQESSPSGPHHKQSYGSDSLNLKALGAEVAKRETTKMNPGTLSVEEAKALGRKQGIGAKGAEGLQEEPLFFPADVALHTVRWCCNAAKPNWLAFGGAAGVLTCMLVDSPYGL